MKFRFTYWNLVTVDVVMRILSFRPEDMFVALGNLRLAT